MQNPLSSSNDLVHLLPVIWKPNRADIYRCQKMSSSTFQLPMVDFGANRQHRMFWSLSSKAITVCRTADIILKLPYIYNSKKDSIFSWSILNLYVKKKTSPWVKVTHDKRVTWNPYWGNKLLHIKKWQHLYWAGLWLDFMYCSQSNEHCVQVLKARFCSGALSNLG